MNPYIANPDEIPPTDAYAHIPAYGRYFPKEDDFYVAAQHVNYCSPTAMRYWASLIQFCDKSLKIFPGKEGGRDVFALGSVIIKSGHLRNYPSEGPSPEIDYSYADDNEKEAIRLASRVLKDVRVPKIYFSGRINGHQVLVQERLPGVTLNVAWQYLSQAEKESFKEQTRDIIAQLHTIEPTAERLARGHIVRDPKILSNGRITRTEADMLFLSSPSENLSLDLRFMHNDLTESNIIVDNGKITGIIDWEMAGWFGWKVAGDVHSRIRGFQREHFVDISPGSLSEEKLEDILFWNDLYAKGFPGV